MGSLDSTGEIKENMYHLLNRKRNNEEAMDMVNELDQLRANAERLAVEVCGLKRVGLMYYSDDGEYAVLVKDWRPRENLIQAWMVKDAIEAIHYENADDPRCEKFCNKFEETDFYVYDARMSARIIFDAAVEAMGFSTDTETDAGSKNV
jgi:hypothetical protein